MRTTQVVIAGREFHVTAAPEVIHARLFAQAVEPLPGDPYEAQQGEPPPIPDPPDTDPIPEPEAE